jgi:hypothetical protein
MWHLQSTALLLLLLWPADAVIDPTPQRVWPYLLLISFAGMFALLGLRNLLILTWRCANPAAQCEI